MKNFFLILFVASFAATFSSCQKHDEILLMDNHTSAETRNDIWGDWTPVGNMFFNDSLTVLGPQLENPYEIENMRMAYAELADSLPDLQLPVVVTSHHYVRFLPQNDEELYALHSSNPSVVFYDYPLDREIVTGGAYYHDPTIADTLPTYQYASIKASTWEEMQESINIDYEILADLFIPEETITFTPRPGIGDGPIFINEVDNNESDNNVTEEAVDLLVKKAMQLTGNYEEPSNINSGMMEINSSDDDEWTPSGRISAYDHVLEDNVPIVGITVRARRWFTTYKGVTDANGYFTCNGTFKNPANYSFKWESDKWDIRDGAVVQASYNHGKKLSGAWNLVIQNNDYKSLRYATIHRALYRIFYGDNGTLFRPLLQNKIKVKYFHRAFSNAPGVLGQFDIGNINTPKNQKVNIYGMNGLRFLNTAEIFSATAHEVGGHSAHSSHSLSIYTTSETTLKESWALCAQYHLTNLEYQSLGVLDKLNASENLEEVLFGWMSPNLMFNMQLFNNEGYSGYTTSLLVDLLDDYNQHEFYCLRQEMFESQKFADDDVVFPDIIKIQNCAFNVTSLDQFRVRFTSLYGNTSIYPQASVELVNRLFNTYYGIWE